MTSVIITNRKLRNDWVELNDPRQLPKFLDINKPSKIYFPFWSWRIPDEITDKYLCVGFHTGTLPDEAGGSPIQNLIRNKILHTHINTFIINNELDGGQVISKEPICLNGSLEEILLRMSDTIQEMIDVQENNRQPDTV